MRRFLVPPELAPSVALSREVKELESDLERRRLAAVAAEEEANKAGLAASLGLTWPLPERGRGPPSRQRQYEEALCRAIDQGVLPEEIVTKVVPVWMSSLKPLLPHWVGVALNELSLRDDVREFGWRPLFVPAGEDREAVIAAAQDLHEEGKLFRPVGASCGGIPEEQPSDGEDPPAAAADEDGEAEEEEEAGRG